MSFVQGVGAVLVVVGLLTLWEWRRDAPRFWRDGEGS